MKTLSLEAITHIKKLRADGLSFDRIGDLLDIDRETATKYSKEVILSEDKKYQMRSDSLRKYQYNTSIFTNEDAISYYLLGVFITDGCITKGGNKYSRNSCLTSKDKDWLEEIRDLICPNKPLSKINNAYTLIMHGRIIYQWLQSHGCDERKSLTIKFPIIPKEYLIDFIRGCFDGDGCLCIYTAKARKNLRVYSYISSASQLFIESFSDALNKFDIETTIGKMKLCNSVISGRPIIAKHNLYRLHLSKLNTYKLCKLIYYPNCLCLQRKQTKSKNIIELCNRT